jgi:hypothetical protein
VFLFFRFPPVIQALVGVAVIVAGVLIGRDALDIVGALLIVRGGYRWLRQRRGAGEIR